MSKTNPSVVPRQLVCSKVDYGKNVSKLVSREGPVPAEDSADTPVRLSHAPSNLIKQYLLRYNPSFGGHLRRLSL